MSTRSNEREGGEREGGDLRVEGEVHEVSGLESLFPLADLLLQQSLLLCDQLLRFGQRDALLAQHQRCLL